MRQRAGQQLTCRIPHEKWCEAGCTGTAWRTAGKEVVGVAGFEGLQAVGLVGLKLAVDEAAVVLVQELVARHLQCMAQSTRGGGHQLGGSRGGWEWSEKSTSIRHVQVQCCAAQSTV